MITLNRGAYYNRFGNCSSIGLTEEAKSMISSTKWYLGNVSALNDSYGTYKEERGTTVHDGNSQMWDGMVGLMYPSDYMFGSTTCYNNGANVTAHNESTCNSTNWLDIGTPCTISPYSVDSNVVIRMQQWSDILILTVENITSCSLKPSVYLSSSVKYVSGNGSASNPFVIQ